jgi:hypothetical protein
MPPNKNIRVVPTSRTPRPYLYRSVKPDWPSLFTKLGEFDLGKPQKWLSTAYGVLAALFTLKPRTIAEEAYILVQRSIAGAVADVLRTTLEGEDRKLAEIRKEAAKHLDEGLAREPIEITTQFFEHPGRSGVVGAVARLLASWFRLAGLEPDEAATAVLALPVHFVSRLANEVTEEKERYERLIEEHAPRFNEVAEVEAAWLRYHTHLHTSVLC